LFGLLITASSSLLDPAQRQITRRHLSTALRKSFVAIWVICRDRLHVADCPDPTHHLARRYDAYLPETEQLAPSALDGGW
jgi:hypothetical protein